MPSPRISREEVVDRLLETFRASGYDGASLAELSVATGLGKSSLYHYFPNGKEDMALQVLERLGQELEGALLAPLRSPGPPDMRLDAMIRVLDHFYDGGRKACLLERLCASVDRARFGRPLAGTFSALIEAIVALCTDAGLPDWEARERAEDVVGRIEGALVLAAGVGDPAVFGRALARIRRSLLAPMEPAAR
ncbi:MAG TPA: TetR/AcrR family transcriptional regulator [Myxococcota bacterium]|nr:TetR/AcrR family transcriptional regulator [Myxococcota bacterium]